jgi:hypothetical protein
VALLLSIPLVAALKVRCLLGGGENNISVREIEIK